MTSETTIEKLDIFFCEIVDTQFISSWNKLKLAI